VRVSVPLKVFITISLSMIVSLTRAPGKQLSSKSEPQSETACGPHCGTERWSVKTLSDSDAAKVDLTQRIVRSVHDLVTLPEPSERPNDNRIVPIETSTFGVQARLVGFKKETDRDFHIVIADPQSKETMIVEIPDPQCAGVCASQARDLISQARKSFVQQCGVPAAKFKRLTSPLLVRVTGVAFFDFNHGQTGVAKNAIELHPVLRIELPDNSDFCAKHLM
jgi:hypothetical protein